MPDSAIKLWPRRMFGCAHIMCYIHTITPRFANLVSIYHPFLTAMQSWLNDWWSIPTAVHLMARGLQTLSLQLIYCRIALVSSLPPASESSELFCIYLRAVTNTLPLSPLPTLKSCKKIYSRVYSSIPCPCGGRLWRHLHAMTVTWEWWIRWQQ